MNILLLTGAVPIRQSTSGSILRLNYFMSHLSKGNRIIVCAFTSHEIKNSDIDSAVFHELNLVKYYSNSNRLVKLLHFFSTDPVHVKQLYSAEMERVIQRIIREKKIDLVYVERMGMAQYVIGIKHVRKIMAQDDAVSMQFLSCFRAENRLVPKVKHLIRFLKTLCYERRIYRQFDVCVVSAQKDKEFLEKYARLVNVHCVPNGVDLAFFSPSKQRVEDSNALLFTGNMGWFINEDAVLRFCKDIFPLIRKVIPDTKFYIVGDRPTARVCALSKDPAIIVTGYVTDIRVYYEKATVVVCPLNMGSGIKNKILEAWAMKKAVVASPLSCEGLRANDGVNLDIGVNTADFVTKVIALLRDEHRRETLASNGRATVERYYHWNHHALNLQKLITSTHSLHEKHYDCYPNV